MWDQIVTWGFCPHTEERENEASLDTSVYDPAAGLKSVLYVWTTTEWAAHDETFSVSVPSLSTCDSHWFPVFHCPLLVTVLKLVMKSPSMSSLWSVWPVIQDCVLFVCLFILLAKYLKDHMILGFLERKDWVDFYIFLISVQLKMAVTASFSKPT